MSERVTVGDLGVDIAGKITFETLGKSSIRFTAFDYNELEKIDITEALHKKGWGELNQIIMEIDDMIKANDTEIDNLNDCFSDSAEHAKTIFTGENMGLQRAKVLLQSLIKEVV